MTEMYENDDRRLDAAVQLGIISAEQAAAIRALTPERERPRQPRPVDASTIGYVLGAITVLVAMGWFLADRWDWLGAGGVLATTSVYIALFVFVAGRLRREGFEVAGGFAVLLAVAMVPVAVVALNELTQWVAMDVPQRCRYVSTTRVFDFALWDCRGLELLMELTTLAAALLALRRVSFSLLVLPVAVIGARFVFHLAAVAASGYIGNTATGLVWIAVASLMTAAAYATDRRQPQEVDYALWLHILAVLSCATASVLLLDAEDRLRHVLPAAAAVAFVFSLRVRRSPWTLLGMGWFVAYLGWLAADVFRDTPVFPIVLAALGLAVIIATVWVQRNAAALVARFGGLTPDGRPSFPGGLGLMLLPLVIPLLGWPDAVRLDREDRRGALLRMERDRGRYQRGLGGAIVVTPDSAEAAPTPGSERETPPARQP